MKAVGLAIAALLAGCRSCPTCPVVPAVKPLPEVRVVTTWTSCIDGEMAAVPDFVAFAPAAPSLCPAPFALCFDRENANAVRVYLESLETWIARAIDRCSKSSTPPEATP